MKGDGSLWAWGWNNSGQFSRSMTASQHVPTRIGTDTDWQSVSEGYYHSLAAKSDGSLWAWGWSTSGQFCGITTMDGHAPTRFGTADAGLKAVNAGFKHALGVEGDGSLWAWGSNWAGQLGDGTSGVGMNAPVRIGSDFDWKAVSAGTAHSIAIKDDGSLWAWGSNWAGQLGDGTNVDKNAPILIDDPAATSGTTILASMFDAVANDTESLLTASPLGAAAESISDAVANYVGTAMAAVITGANQLKSTHAFIGDPIARLNTVPSMPTPDAVTGHVEAATPTTTATETGSADTSSLEYSTNRRFLGKDRAAGSATENEIRGEVAERSIERALGSDRYLTAIEASKKNFDSADSVVLATGANYADALSAAALAGALNAPLLLTDSSTLSDGVLSETDRLGATEVWIMGSDKAVSATVEASLKKAGLSTERVAGVDRYATSAEAAKKVAELEGAVFADKAFLARGDDLADGIAVSPVAYSNKIPVLLTSPNALSGAASDAITALGIKDVTILGSPSAIATGAEDSVGGIVPTKCRVGGVDRYETAQAIAEYAFDNSLVAKNSTGVATDKRRDTLTLIDPKALSPDWAGFLSSVYAGAKPDLQHMASKAHSTAKP